MTDAAANSQTEESVIKEKKKGLKSKEITKQELTALNKALEARIAPALVCSTFIAPHCSQDEAARRAALPSLLDRLVRVVFERALPLVPAPDRVPPQTRYANEPFAIATHEECVRLMLADMAAGKASVPLCRVAAGTPSLSHTHTRCTAGHVRRHARLRRRPDAPARVLHHGEALWLPPHVCALLPQESQGYAQMHVFEFGCLLIRWLRCAQPSTCPSSRRSPPPPLPC